MSWISPYFALVLLALISAPEILAADYENGLAPPGAPRERHIRQADQVIVFLDDCRYERTDSATGHKTVQERKSGDVIWHNKGEDAPQLINLGAKPYRTMVIELK